MTWHGRLTAMSKSVPERASPFLMAVCRGLSSPVSFRSRLAASSCWYRLRLGSVAASRNAATVAGLVSPSRASARAAASGLARCHRLTSGIAAAAASPNEPTSRSKPVSTFWGTFGACNASRTWPNSSVPSGVASAALPSPAAASSANLRCGRSRIRSRAARGSPSSIR